MKNWKQYYLLLMAPLLFVACVKEKKECPGSVEEEIHLSNFYAVSAGENFSVDIKKGNTCTIKAYGCLNDLEDLDLSVGADNVLNIQFNHYRSNRYRVDFVITTPSLVAINAGGSAKFNVSGFEQQPQPLSVIAGGAAECDVNGSPQDVTFTTGGTAELAFNAPTLINSITGTSGGTSRVSAYLAPAKKANVQSGGTSKIYVAVDSSLTAGAAGDSRIFYKGSPVKVDIQQSGVGKVVREY